MHDTVIAARPVPAITARKASRRKKRVALLGNFPPRRCGIATFTADVFTSLEDNADCIVVAMKDAADEHSYDAPVQFVIRQSETEDYVAAAQALNEAGIDVVSLQHEFGIFGGPAGEQVLHFLDRLKCAVVSTLHTVLKNPDEDQCRVLSAIIRRSSRVIVMSPLGRDVLIERYNTPAGKILVVPHGAPDRPFVSTDSMKEQLGLSTRDVLLTFGLLSPNKGIESVIRALPEIIKARPQALYVILGATHPHQVLRDGEAYRSSLRDLAEKLDVSSNVQFVDSYVDLDALLDYLTAADVYITPYLNAAQVTSGTLSYAVALGKPVVSTPYWHAEELLADGVGVLVPFDDDVSIAKAVGGLLTDPERRGMLAECAYNRGRETIWERSGEAYLAACDDAIREHQVRTSQRTTPTVVEPSFSAVSRMSDDCGMLQHAKRAIPDRLHGYCIDDTARALILFQRGARIGVRLPLGPRRMETYAAFVEHAWNPDVGRFRNFMSYDRQWLEARGSEDSSGRAMWALGETAYCSTDGNMRQWAVELADRVAPYLMDLRPLRASAFCVLGLRRLIAADPGNAAFSQLLRDCAYRLRSALVAQRKLGWTWFEPTLTYDNARLPEAMLVASEVLCDHAMRVDALAALKWLAGVQTSFDGSFQPVGNESFYVPYVTPSPYDQQPVEAAAMVDACATAYALTGEPAWIGEAARAHAWFLGENIAGESVRSADGVGCHDGIGRMGMNVNQGAESLLAFQLANCTIKHLLARSQQSVAAT